MLLWIGLGLLSAGVLAAVLRPLLRPPSHVSTPPYGSAIYRDQLREIDADRERGLLGVAEAEAARTEIARRILANESDLPQSVENTKSTAVGMSEAFLGRIAIGLAGGLPLAAISIYLFVGQPNVPDQPLSARIATPSETARVDELVGAVEARLKQHPEDGQGWEVIGPVYLKQQRFQDAADAFARATRLLGESSRRLAGFAESTVLANDGIVTEPARLAYEKLVKLEPSRIEPHFWLALAKEQDGKLDLAIADYQSILATGPADASWRPMIEDRLTAARGKLAGGPVPPPATALPSPVPQSPAAQSPATQTAARGPSADDVAAAERLSPADRQKMIEGMVQGLAARLAKDGRDLAGWQRLISAYTTMGRKADAIAALRTARQTFGSEPQSLIALDTLARNLGLDS